MNSWFYIAQIFVKIGKLKEAEKCIDEIKNLGRGNQSKILFIRGLIKEAEGDLPRAVRFMCDSISINSQNKQVLVHLSTIYSEMENFTKAEKCLRDAIVLEPGSADLWLSLGMVLESRGEDSSSCFIKSAELDQSRPIIDYNILSIHS